MQIMNQTIAGLAAGPRSGVRPTIEVRTRSAAISITLLESVPDIDQLEIVTMVKEAMDEFAAMNAPSGPARAATPRNVFESWAYR